MDGRGSLVGTAYVLLLVGVARAKPRQEEAGQLHIDPVGSGVVKARWDVLKVLAIVTWLLAGCGGDAGKGASYPSSTTYRQSDVAHVDQLVMVTLKNLGDHYGLNVTVDYNDMASDPSANCGVAQDGAMNGWVHLNRRIMLELWARYQDAGVVGVIAHEMAHIVTCAAVQTRKVFQRDFELLADCLTGDYMAAYYPNNDMTALRKMWRDFGDYEFAAWGHHGTPEQRHNAFTEGFFNRRDGRVDDAVRATLMCLIPMGYKLQK